MSIWIGVWSLAICAFLLTFYYGTSSPWWRAWEGRAIFTLALTHFVWFGLTIAFHKWPPPSLVIGIGNWAIIAAIDAVMITLLISDICARIKDWRKRRNHDKHLITPPERS